MQVEEALLHWFVKHKRKLALAESCTGGLLAAGITSVPGASQYFLGSFVVYSDEMKERILDVSRKTLETHGAVSAQTVQEMLQGVFEKVSADFAIAVSGIAGPGGGLPQKPVGTVFAAIGERGKPPDIREFQAHGSRQEIMETTVDTLLGALLKQVEHLTNSKV